MSDKVACWSWCASTKDCNWVSFETTGLQTCSLFEHCSEIDEEHYPQYVSGHRDCQYTQCKVHSNLDITNLDIVNFAI